MHTLLIAFSVLLLAGCASTPRAPLKTVDYVDLTRFMGDWYVIANIPTFIEKDAYNAVESYRLDPDGTIATTFTFNKGGFEGPRKTYTPRGYVLDVSSNAVWGMQFIWPIKADYRIVHLTEDYGQTVIAREKRDYVWIMAREPSMPEAEYQRLLQMLSEQGYDVALIRKTPQREAPGPAAAKRQ